MNDFDETCLTLGGKYICRDGEIVTLEQGEDGYLHANGFDYDAYEEFGHMVYGSVDIHDKDILGFAE
jgi:hypothetical protein